MTSAIDLAYCAGLVDGEGCIRVKRTAAYRCQGKVTPGYHATIQIRMVDEEAIKLIAETLGGWYYPEKPHLAQGRPLFCYQATDKAAEIILRALLPYLRVKRQAALNVLALRELQATGRAHRTKYTGEKRVRHRSGTVFMLPAYSFTDEYVAQCDTFYQRSRELNRVGI